MVEPVTPDLAQAFGLAKASGAIVTTVIDEAPGNGAFQPGDVITQFDGKSVRDHRGFAFVVGITPIGNKASVVVWRDGAERTVPVTVLEWGEMRGPVTAASTVANDAARAEPPNFGWKLDSPTETIRSRFNLAPNAAGVAVVEIMPGGAAAESDVAPGDLIVTVQRVQVTTPDAVQAQLDGLRNQNRPYAPLLVQRGATRHWATLRLFPLGP
jgi:serine protease Do